MTSVCPVRSSRTHKRHRLPFLRDDLFHARDDPTTADELAVFLIHNLRAVKKFALEHHREWIIRMRAHVEPEEFFLPRQQLAHFCRRNSSKNNPLAHDGWRASEQALLIIRFLALNTLIVQQNTINVLKSCLRSPNRSSAPTLISASNDFLLNALCETRPAMSARSLNGTVHFALGDNRLDHLGTKVLDHQQTKTNLRVGDKRKIFSTLVDVR